MSRPGGRPLRLAVLIALRPRKLGSLESWMVLTAREARARGHRIDLFARDPIHPIVKEALAEAGAGYHRLEELETRPLLAAARLGRNYDALHLNLLAPRDRATLVASAAWPARVLYVDHISGPPGASSTRGALRQAIDRLSMARIAGLAGVSDYVRDRDRARFGRQHVRTLYNGVDLDLFRPPGPARTREGPIRVAAVANLIPEKGIEHLLRAVARLDAGSFQLSIVGDGPQDEHLRRRARELGIDQRTTFLGLRDDVAELLRNTDVFVHPAVWAEAFGLTIAEAMASGCAVVATAMGGIPELVVDGESGLLVPAGDDQALAEALSRLQRDGELRARLGAAARRRTEQRFSLTDCVQRHLDWCEEIGQR